MTFETLLFPFSFSLSLKCSLLTIFPPFSNSTSHSVVSVGWPIASTVVHWELGIALHATFGWAFSFFRAFVCCRPRLPSFSSYCIVFYVPGHIGARLLTWSHWCASALHALLHQGCGRRQTPNARSRMSFARCPIPDLSMSRALWRSWLFACCVF